MTRNYQKIREKMEPMIIYSSEELAKIISPSIFVAHQVIQEMVNDGMIEEVKDGYRLNQ